MSSADAKDASELTGVLEEYVLRCLFSKNWQLREAALQYIERQLSGDVSIQTCRVLTLHGSIAALDLWVDKTVFPTEQAFAKPRCLIRQPQLPLRRASG